MIKSFTNENFISSVVCNKISYGFYSRQGGVSEGAYASLNCGIGSDDIRDRVIENRKRVASDLGAHHNNLLSVFQVHGSKCIVCHEPWGVDQRPEADAMVTDVKGLALGILTADCAPVLFYGFKSNDEIVIGAAHAGWKGALSGVLEETVDAMLSLGAKIETIKGGVGPCISRSSYEVSYDFCEPFIEHHDEAVRFFRSGSKSSCIFFDLSAYCAWRLFQKGVKSITLFDQDTYADEENFYSYRRMTHKGQTEYGRQISAISIKE